MQRLQSFSALVSLTASFWVFQPLQATAQLIPDNSLGNESSVVVPNQNINGLDSDRIDGGAIRGSNLFHSFQEFNIDNGRGAYFSNPGNISNILTRVTGSNLSNILGTLGVLGNANVSAPLNVNLFLINPNGIVFGPNARLDVGGSFFASTADSILFENGVEFAASNPDAPPLLTINIPIGLNFRENPGSIVNQATLTTLEDGSPLRDNNGFLVPQGLNVPQNQTLALVGGDVLFDNGVAISPGSNIELGGLSELGIVELNADGSLTFPSNIQQANIALTNNSQINIRADNGGDININAANFEMSGGSIIRAGIDEFLGSPEAQVGIININAQDTVSLSEGSFVSNVINTDGIGKPGEINVTANSVSMSGGSFLGTQSFGQGNGGNVTIETDQIQLNEVEIITSNLGQGNAGNISIQASDSVLLIGGNFFTDIEENGIGNAGNVTIETNQLQLNGSQIATGNLGQGNAGSVIIQAFESVQLINSDIFSRIGENGIGNGGKVEIDTAQLEVLSGSQIDTGTLGQGNSGSIFINASNAVTISGVTPDGGEFPSALVIDTEEGAVGDSGSILIETNQLIIKDNGVISASSTGESHAGNITIKATEFIEIAGLPVSGEGGNIFAAAKEGSSGNAGNITIETGQLRMRDGAQINALTNGEGNAGTITVKAENISMNGNIFVAEGERFTTGISAQSGTIGNAGTIIIEAQRLRLTNGAFVDVAADGAGDAGTIIARANDVELLDGVDDQNSSLLDASVKPVNINGGSGTGSGGSVTVEAERLVLRNGGRIEARTANGIGKSAQVTITASESVELSGITPDASVDSSIFTNTTGSANAGDITIITPSLSVRDRSSFTATSDENSTGNAGNMRIIATDAVEITGSVSSNTFGAGNGGNISIETGRLTVAEGGAIATDAFDGASGSAGNLRVIATEEVIISDGFLRATNQGIGNGGDITVNTERLVLNNARIAASSFLLSEQNTLNGGDAGNVDIYASELVELNNNSGIFANTYTTGDAGNVNIQTETLRVSDNSRIFVVSFSSENSVNFNLNTLNGGDAGNVDIYASELVELNENSGISARTQTIGDAGNVTIQTETLRILDGSIIAVNSESSGIPGNIDVTATSTLVEDQSFFSATSEAGQGGNIKLRSNDIRLLNGSAIIANGSEEGETFEGNIEIDADLLVLLGGSGIITNAFSLIGGSNINIRPFNDSNSVNSSIGILLSTDSIISAAGDLTIDSAVTFKPADVPEVAVTDPNDLIAQEFCRQRGGSEFVVTGKGGIAADPNDKADGNQIEVDLVEPVPSNPRNTSQKRSEIEDNQAISSLDIIPARGWIRDENGDVILVGYDPTKTGVRRQPSQLPQCQP